MQDRIRAIGQYVHGMIQEAEAFEKELPEAEMKAADKDRVTLAVNDLLKREEALSSSVAALESKKADLEKAIEVLRAKYFA